MSTLKLTTYTSNKPKAKTGMFWDRMSQPATEPPYRRLPEYHIRVVKIKPGEEKWPIRVKLKTIDPRKTKYTALSYTYENESDDSLSASATTRSSTAEVSSTILCGGTPVKVSRNLWDALCQLKDINSDVPVFIDALCIDMANPEERAAQIEIMGHIYSRAASVIVWLGKKDRFSDDTIMIMRKLTNAIDWRRIGDASSYNFRDPNFFIQIGMEPLTIQQWRNIHRFCHLKWFSRVWAFYELALAKRAVFLLGDTCMDYEFVIDFGMILGLSGWLDEMGELSGTDDKGHVAGLTKMLGPVARLRAIPPWHPMHVEYSAWMDENYGLKTDLEKAWKFFEILLESAEAFDCQDPRDRVHAPLAFIRTVFAGQTLNKQWPAPDYERTAETVYTHFAGLIEKHTHSPSMLATAPTENSEESLQKTNSSNLDAARVPLD